MITFIQKAIRSFVANTKCNVKAAQLSVTLFRRVLDGDGRRATAQFMTGYMQYLLDNPQLLQDMGTRSLVGVAVSVKSDRVCVEDEEVQIALIAKIDEELLSRTTATDRLFTGAYSRAVSRMLDAYVSYLGKNVRKRVGINPYTNN